MVQLWDDLFALGRERRAALLLTPHGHVFPVGELGHAPLQRRQWRPVQRAYQADGLPGHARADQGTAGVRDPALGRQRSAVRVGPLERDAPGAGRGPAGLLRGLYRATSAHSCAGWSSRCTDGRTCNASRCSGPELHWKPWLNEPVFRHQLLDFANNHFYAEGTIDHPQDTVSPALAVAQLMAEAMAGDHRWASVLRHRARPDPHLQGSWDHPAGAVRRRILSADPVDAPRLRRRRGRHAMAQPQPAPADPRHAPRPAQPRRLPEADRLAPLQPPHAERRSHLQRPRCRRVRLQRLTQAVLYLLRQRPLLDDGRLDPAVRSDVSVHIPGLEPGRYRATLWDTTCGRAAGSFDLLPTNHGHSVTSEEPLEVVGQRGGRGVAPRGPSPGTSGRSSPGRRGTPGRSRLGGAGSCSRTWTTVSITVPARNGGRPVSSS